MAKRKYTALEQGICGKIPWWFREGSKMVLNKELSIKGNVQIENKNTMLRVYRESGSWEIQWNVDHGFRIFLYGQIRLSTEALQAAFGVTDKCKENDRAFAKKFGATILVPNVFIRNDQIVSFPGYSTGFLISPVISLALDNEITGAIRELIETHE